MKKSPRASWLIAPIVIILLALESICGGQEVGHEFVDGWTATAVETHTEFLRISLISGSAKTQVEIRYRGDEEKGRWTTKFYHVQPSPGFKAPHALLDAVAEHYRTLEEEPGHRAIVSQIRREHRQIPTASRPFSVLPFVGAFMVACWFASCLVWGGVRRLATLTHSRCPSSHGKCAFGGLVLLISALACLMWLRPSAVRLWRFPDCVQTWIHTATLVQVVPLLQLLVLSSIAGPVVHILRLHKRRQVTELILVLLVCIGARVVFERMAVDDSLICGGIGFSRISSPVFEACFTNQNWHPPPTIHELVRMSRLIGILTIPAIAFLSLFVFDSPRAAAMCSLVAAFSPVAIKYAATASTGPACIGAQGAAFLCLAAWLQSKRRGCSLFLPMMSIALVTSAKARPEAALFVCHIPLVVMILTTRNPLDSRSFKILVIGVLLSLVSIALTSGSSFAERVRSPVPVALVVLLLLAFCATVTLSDRLRANLWQNRVVVGLSSACLLVWMYRIEPLAGVVSTMGPLELLGRAAAVVLATLILRRGMNLLPGRHNQIAIVLLGLLFLGLMSRGAQQWWVLAVLPASIVFIMLIEHREAGAGITRILVGLGLALFLFRPFDIFAVLRQATLDLRILPLWHVVAVAYCCIRKEECFGKDTLLLLCVAFLPVLAETGSPLNINFPLDVARYVHNASLWPLVFAGGALALILQVKDGMLRSAGAMIAVLTVVAALVSIPWLRTEHDSMHQYNYARKVVHLLPPNSLLIVEDDQGDPGVTWEIGSDVAIAAREARPDVEVMRLTDVVRNKARLRPESRSTYLLEGYLSAYLQLPSDAQLLSTLLTQHESADGRWIKARYNTKVVASETRIGPWVFDAYSMNPMARDRSISYRLLRVMNRRLGEKAP